MILDQNQFSRPVLGIRFSQLSMDDILALVTRPPRAGQGALLTVTANVDHIVLLRKNAALRDAYAHAWQRTIDGAPVFLYSRLRGADVPQRVTGADLFPRLMEKLAGGPYRLFLVVADETIRNRLLQWASENGLAGAMEIDIPPFGFEKDEEYGRRLAQRIRDHGTTHLIFGVGCPRSEVWVDRHRDQLGDCYAFAVGAAVAFFVGTIRRAPVLAQRVGLEWAWRVAAEPRRLAARYFVGSWTFFGAVIDDLKSRSS